MQRASGIPHALNGAEDSSTPRALRAAGAKAYLKLERRHCERSEAIHSFFVRQDGLLRFARNDGLSMKRMIECSASIHHQMS